MCLHFWTERDLRTFAGFRAPLGPSVRPAPFASPTGRRRAPWSGLLSNLKFSASRRRQEGRHRGGAGWGGGRAPGGSAAKADGEGTEGPEGRRRRRHQSDRPGPLRCQAVPGAGPGATPRACRAPRRGSPTRGRGRRKGVGGRTGDGRGPGDSRRGEGRAPAGRANCMVFIDVC